MAFGDDIRAGPQRERRECDTVLFIRLLDAGRLQILQNHLREGLLSVGLNADLFGWVDQVVVFIDAQHPMGGKALDRERTSHTNLFVIWIGLVVEGFKLGLSGAERAEVE